MPRINWKLIAFCVVLFWIIYSAPTEGSIVELLTASSASTQADNF